MFVRPTIALSLVCIVTIAAFAFDCKVTCPSGYRGGCVKSPSGCDCSCDKNAKDGHEHILKALATAGASDEVMQKATDLLSKQELIPETTLEDSQTHKTYTIFLQ
jgi:hypothetical protein